MLDELRNKPKLLKEAYAFWTAFIITGVIAIVWAISFSLDMGQTNESASGNEKIETTSAIYEFFGKIQSNFRETWEEGRAAIEEGKEAESKEEGGEENAEPATSTSSNTKPKGGDILIATSSKPVILIGTSSSPERWLYVTIEG